MSKDETHSLSDQSELAKRKAMLHEPHVQLLTTFVEQIRDENPGRDIPYFDPCDGGVNARCLFVFQDPGPKAVESDFISRDNPDPSAKEFSRLNRETGLCRKATASWNIIPWHVDSINTRTRQAGVKCLNRLLPSFDDLKLIVLAGREAQRAAKSIHENWPDRLVIFMPHPSQRVMNRWHEKRQQIRSVLELTARALDAL